MKKLRVLQDSVDTQQKARLEEAGEFVFCEKSTGIAQFRAASNADPNSTVERVAGLLAMQCLVRGHDPEDFVVLVPAEGHLVGRFRSRAKELLEEGRAAARPAALSPRQNEILLSVIRNRANKEIASKLNITVRTVKFHISTLLDKFGVDNRAELARRAAGFLKREVAGAEASDFHSGPYPADDPANHSQPLGPVPLQSSSRRLEDKSRNLRFTGRVLTA